MRHRRAVFVLLGLMAAARPARAQEPRERATLDSIRANFQAVTDSNYLVSYERQRIGVARTDRDNPFIHMELGYVALRLGELTGAKKRYQDAASEFQWAADLRARWPYAWYYLGLAELSSGEADLVIVENLRQIFGQDALSQAVRSFAHAIEVDPTFSQALVDLANAAMRQRINPRLMIAQAALRQAASVSAGVPEVQLVRGRIERRMLGWDSALVAFHLYLQHGGDSAIGEVELARTFAQKGDADSAMQAYFRGVARPLSDSARVEVRRDLRWFATPDELQAYDRTPADSAARWLRRFWFGRDMQEGRRLGERLSEQFRRYQFAIQNFSLPSRRRGFDVAFAFRDTSQQDFDDRGVIYLRHGPPVERSVFTGNGYEPNESWLYRQGPPQGDMILHFLASNDVQDYRLVQSLLDVCTRRFSSDPLQPGVSNAATGSTTTDALVGIWRDCVRSRSTLSPEYERLARLSDNASQNVWASERQQSMTMVHSATTTDSYRQRFTNELRPIVSLFAIGDAERRPELHLVFAVPAERLHPRQDDAGATYPLELRMLVYDSASHLVGALDTVRVFRTGGRLGAGAWLTEQMVMKVQSGRYRYSFVIQELDDSTGDAVAGQDIEIPRLDSAFAASDVVMGRENSGLVWRRPDGVVPLNPLMRFPRDGQATLYYELYGLPQGAQVVTRVRIQAAGGRSVFRRIFGGGGGADLSYTTVTDAPLRTRVQQTLALRGLSPGRYILRLELTDPQSGHTVTRESPFEIDGNRSS